MRLNEVFVQNIFLFYKPLLRYFSISHQLYHRGYRGCRSPGYRPPLSVPNLFGVKCTVLLISQQSISLPSFDNGINIYVVFLNGRFGVGEYFFEVLNIIFED